MSNSGRNALRAFPTHFASSISLERAVALAFCESVLDWAFGFMAPLRVSELDWTFEFIFFKLVFFDLELDWRLDVSRTSPSGIDAKLDMCVVCVLCIDEHDRLYHNYWSKTCPELYSNFIWENHSLYPLWPYLLSKSQYLDYDQCISWHDGNTLQRALIPWLDGCAESIKFDNQINCVTLWLDFLEWYKCQYGSKVECVRMH